MSVQAFRLVHGPVSTNDLLGARSKLFVPEWVSVILIMTASMTADRPAASVGGCFLGGFEMLRFSEHHFAGDLRKCCHVPGTARQASRLA